MEIQEAEDALDKGDFIRASELYRHLSLAPSAPDSLLADFVTAESLLIRAHLRRKLELEPGHIYSRVLLAARVEATEALMIYTDLLEESALSPHARCRILLKRFGLFASKHVQYPNAANDFLEARHILTKLNPNTSLYGTFAAIATIDTPTSIPVLQDIADGLSADSDAVDFIKRKIEELRALAMLQAGPRHQGPARE